MSTTGPEFEPPRPSYPPPGQPPPEFQPPQQPGYPPPGQPPPGQPPPGYQQPPGQPSYQPIYQPTGHPGGAAKAGTSGKAIASLVLGILCCVPLLGVAAIVLGVLALRDIGRSSGALGGRGLAITGVVLGALQTVVIVAIGGVLLANPDVFESIPGEPSEILEVGECLDLDLNQTEVTISRSDVVPCDQPHSAEYAGSPLVSDPPDAEYPGDEALLDEGLELCLDEFERLMGRSLFDEPDLDLFILYPQEFNWDLFDQRTIDCFITSFDGSPLTAPILD